MFVSDTMPSGVTNVSAIATLGNVSGTLWNNIGGTCYTNANGTVIAVLATNAGAPLP